MEESLSLGANTPNCSTDNTKHLTQSHHKTFEMSKFVPDVHISTHFIINTIISVSMIKYNY